MSRQKVFVTDKKVLQAKTIRLNAKMILEKKLPCEVICASSGFDGLEILRNERVNLVLLDILMPVYDGIETLAEIRDDERIKNVPVRRRLSIQS